MKKKISGFLIYLFCLVLVLLAYFYTVYQPFSQKNAALDARHSQNTDQIKTYQKELSDTKAINDKIAELQKKLETEKKDAPVGGSRIAEDAAKAWSAAGVFPQEIQVGNETVAKDQTASGTSRMLTVPVSIKAVCSQEQMQKLLNYFEKQSAGCYYVDSVQYTQNKQNADLYTVNLSLTLYYFGTAPKAK